MHLLSLNVGRPQLVNHNGGPVSTAIFKTLVKERLQLRKLNLDGDRQADLTVHGGPTKAVYLYPSEHYDFWRKELPDMTLPWGMFGENLTTEGLLETEVNIGDKFSVGTAEIMVTEPRMPCYKLGIRFGRTDIIKRFLQSQRTGFYFAVLREGEVGVGDSFELLERNSHGLKVSDVTALFSVNKNNIELLRRAIAVPELPLSWRAHFEEQLKRVSVGR